MARFSTGQFGMQIPLALGLHMLSRNSVASVPVRMIFKLESYESTLFYSYEIERTLDVEFSMFIKAPFRGENYKMLYFSQIQETCDMQSFEPFF